MTWRRLLHPAFLAAAGLLAASAAGMNAAISAYDIYITKKPVHAEGGRTLLAVLRETENWEQVGRDVVVSKEVLEVLGTENYLTRLYAEKNPPAGRRPRLLDLHLAYYTGMIDTVPHVPERCFVGGGMALLKSPRIVPLPLDRSDWAPVADVPREDWKGRVFTTRLSTDYGDGRGARVVLPRDPGTIRLRVGEYAEGDRVVYSGYFFIANGGHAPRAEDVRLLAFNLTDDYAYYLKVQVTSTTVSSAEELAEAAAGLLDDLLGDIMRCVPDWTEVERGAWPPDNPRGAAGPADTDKDGRDERR